MKNLIKLKKEVNSTVFLVMLLSNLKNKKGFGSLPCLLSIFNRLIMAYVKHQASLV